MSKHLLHKECIPDLIQGILGHMTVIAPTYQGDLLLYDEISSPEEVVLGVSTPKLSAKEVFFPRTEVMFEYGSQGATPCISDEERVLFGVRPCDAASLPLLDKVFDAPDFADTYYVARREHTTLVGMACSQPQTTCFCTAVGGGPYHQAGLDVLLADIGDRYLVEAVTEKGERLLSDAADLLDEPTAADLRTAAELVRNAEAHISADVPLAGLTEVLAEAFDEPFWATLQEECLGCGVCTYSCPTCHCFDVVDEGTSTHGKRLRIWDSCQYPLFTLHTSGHNPRPSSKERMRQRVMHKFRYFVERYGEMACVGCGRCIRNCPVNMDIRVAVTEIGARRAAVEG